MLVFAPRMTNRRNVGKPFSREGEKAANNGVPLSNCPGDMLLRVPMVQAQGEFRG